MKNFVSHPLKRAPAALFCAVALGVGSAFGQVKAAAFSDANWISMNPSIPGADNYVYAAVVDGSGNLYIGGNFSFVGDVMANYIAKWDGSGWTALGSGLNNA